MIQVSQDGDHVIFAPDVCVDEDFKQGDVCINQLEVTPEVKLNLNANINDYKDCGSYEDAGVDKTHISDCDILIDTLFIHEAPKTHYKERYAPHHAGNYVLKDKKLKAYVPTKLNKVNKVCVDREVDLTS